MRNNPVFPSLLEQSRYLLTLRRRLGVSQTDLAAVMRVTGACLSECECGKRWADEVRMEILHLALLASEKVTREDAARFVRPEIMGALR